jgi:DNA polymerase-3 subunit delta'
MHPVSFSQIFGNELVKEQLDRMLSKHAVGHALCFAGPDGIGKSLFAWALASRILEVYDPGTDHTWKIQSGQHPDIHVLRPEGKLGLHSIQALRQFSEEVYLPPFEASWKAFIIHDADRMLSYSANALLKTFEEPPAKTVIILLTKSKAALLPTILSRCSTVHFQPVDTGQIEAFLKSRFALDEPACRSVARQAKGSIGRAVRLVESGHFIVRNEILNILSQGPLSNYTQLRESIKGISDRIEESKKQAEESAKEELCQVETDQMTASLKHSMEKEIEGIAAVILAQEAQAIFETVVSWYRDIQAMLVGAPPTLLENPEYADLLEQAIQRGEIKPLHEVMAFVQEAELSLQRSTSLTICLESLILKLLSL